MRVLGSEVQGSEFSKVQGSEVQDSLVQRSQVHDSGQPLAAEVASLIEKETLPGASFI
jgi:hypothetical protein